MSPAVNRNQLYLNPSAVHFGVVVAPDDLLDAHPVGYWGLVRLRRADDVVEVRKVLTGLSRRLDLAVPVEQAEEADVSAIERD